VKRTATVVLVAGIGILVALAIADALRPAKSARHLPAPTTARPEPDGLLEILRREQVTGFMLYSDADCRLHSLTLPRLSDDLVREVNGAAVRQCGLSTSGGRVLTDDRVASPNLDWIAHCHRTQVIVRDWTTGTVGWRRDGCPFAWRPDSRLTQVVGGQIVEGGRVLYSRADLRRAARAHPSAFAALDGHDFKVYVSDFAWLDQNRLVAALDIEPASGASLFLAALFDGKTLTGIAASPLGPYDSWIVSPSGTYAAASNGTIVSRDGRTTDPPAGLPPGHAAAFSPDERWLAYATGGSVFLVGTPLNDERGRLIRLPKPAIDVVWEPVTAATSQQSR
jgi:hypothetical protein